MRLELLGATQRRKGMGFDPVTLTAVGTGVVAVAPKLGDTFSKVTSFFGGGKPDKDVLIRNRDGIFDMFEEVGYGRGTPVLDKAVKDNRMYHDAIPAKKSKGENYSPEFARLHQMVIDVFRGMGRTDLADYFRMNVPVYTDTVHPIYIIKELLARGQDKITNAEATVGPTGEQKNNFVEKKDNTALYVGIGGGALLLTAVGIAFARRKKKSSGLGRIRKPKARKSVK